MKQLGTSETCFNLKYNEDKMYLFIFFLGEMEACENQAPHLWWQARIFVYIIKYFNVICIFAIIEGYWYIKWINW